MNSRFHVRKNVAPLKPVARTRRLPVSGCFHVREEVAPLKRRHALGPRRATAYRFHVLEDVALLKRASHPRCPCRQSDGLPYP